MYGFLMIFNESFASEKNIEALKCKLDKDLILKQQTLNILPSTIV
jgi:hypothetical protein